jgi:hypothetical protein
MGDVLAHAAEGDKVDKACIGRREEVRKQIAGHHPNATGFPGLGLDGRFSFR